MNVFNLQKELLGVNNTFVKAHYPLLSFEIENFEEMQSNLVKQADFLEEKVDLSKLENTSAAGIGLSKNITYLHSYVNFFDCRLFDDLFMLLSDMCYEYQKDVYGIDEQLYCKAWINKLGVGDALARHAHCHDINGPIDKEVGMGFSLHLSIKADPNGYTYYVPVSNNMDKTLYNSGSHYKFNKPGSVTIFPSNLLHGTTPNLTPDPRYTLAMDMGAVNNGFEWRELTRSASPNPESF